MAFFGVKLRDDRGTSVSITLPGSPVVALGAGLAQDTREIELRRRFEYVDQQARAEFNKKHQGLGGLLGFLASLVFVVLASVIPGLPKWLSYAGVSLGIASVSLAFAYRHRHTRATRCREIALSLGVCPSCLYGLIGVPASEDGCVVCPECAAAWTSDGIGALASTPTLNTASPPQAIAASARNVRYAPDARGRIVPIVAPALSVPTPQVLGADGAERLEAARRWMKPPRHSLWWARAAPVAVAGIFIACSVVIAIDMAPTLPTAPSQLTWSSAWRLLGFFAVELVCFCVAVQAARASWSATAPIAIETIKQALLRQGLCPSCAGDLRPVQPEADGATVCPTCRAAWFNVRRPVYGAEVGRREA